MKHYLFSVEETTEFLPIQFFLLTNTKSQMLKKLIKPVNGNKIFIFTFR